MKKKVGQKTAALTTCMQPGGFGSQVEMIITYTLKVDGWVKPWHIISVQHFKWTEWTVDWESQGYSSTYVFQRGYEAVFKKLFSHQNF